MRRRCCCTPNESCDKLTICGVTLPSVLTLVIPDAQWIPFITTPGSNPFGSRSTIFPNVPFTSPSPSILGTRIELVYIGMQADNCVWRTEIPITFNGFSIGANTTACGLVNYNFPTAAAMAWFEYKYNGTGLGNFTLGMVMNANQASSGINCSAGSSIPFPWVPDTPRFIQSNSGSPQTTLVAKSPESIDCTNKTMLLGKSKFRILIKHKHCTFFGPPPCGPGVLTEPGGAGPNDAWGGSELANEIDLNILF